jgi:SAM-dependent methyltransferase
MNLLDIFQRNMNPKPWEEGERIPWHDPDFSRRMLREHLSQEHDAASRRTALIEKHVQWIHVNVLGERRSRILDLGCGPGLYSARLAALGHVTVGIDISPASIEHAREHSPDNCRFVLGDMRTEEFGTGFDLVMLIFGEFNIFRSQEATSVLRKAWAALKPGGKLLLEISSFEALHERGHQPAGWYSAADDLFGDAPHLCLMESFWDGEQDVAVERYFILDVSSGDVTRHSASLQAYSEARLEELLLEAGFQKASNYPDLTGEKQAVQEEMFVILAAKEA